jgi:purine catabolism regulator
VTIGPLSVAAALALPVLRRALPEVVAGQEGLERTVRWVHVVDVPKPDGLLRGGELVLSTGAGAGIDPRTQRGFIRSLADQDAAGLLIELGYTYEQGLPPALIAEASDRGLPLIATHRASRFVDITEAIHGALVDRRLALLRRANEAGERLTQVVLERRELGELLRELARALRNPVMLENIAGQLVGYATYESGERELLEAHAQYRRARRPEALEGRGWLAVEVHSGGHPWGQLTALELDSPLHAEDRAVLERGAQAVALQLLDSQHAEQLRDRARGTFLVDLMRGRILEEDAARRAAALEFPGDRGRLLAGALGWRSERWSEVAATPDAAWGTLIPALRASARQRPLLVGLHAGLVLLVCRLPDGEPTSQQLDALAADLRAPLRHRGLAEADVAVAFGGADAGWTGAGRRLERAANAVLAARALAPTPWRDAGHGAVVDLLYALRRSPELLAFTRDQLGPLFDATDSRSKELLRTLEAYLANSGRKAEAARALHLTRQSLYLRLDRLERLLGVDLEDPDVVLALHLSVRALRLTQALSPDERF